MNPPKKRGKTLLIVIVLIVVALAVGLKINANLHPIKTTVRTVTATRGNLIIPVSETGTIVPDGQVDIKSKVAGRLLTLPIEEGEYIRKGQLVATVDTTNLDPQIAADQAQLDSANSRLAQSIASYKLQLAQTRDAIEQAQASYNSAVAHLATTKAGSRPEELQQQEDAVKRAQITLDDAKRTFARRKLLLSKGFVSQSDVDAAEVALDTAESSLASAQEQLNLLHKGPRAEDVHEAEMEVDSQKVALDSAKANALQDDVTKANIAQSVASVQQIKNELDQLKVQLSNTHIVAPASGIVLKKYREVNEIVQDATTSFSSSDARIATLGNRPKVKVNINEIDIPKVAVGDQANVTVDSIPGITFNAYVATVAPVSTNALNTDDASSAAVSKFPVTILFRQNDPRLRPGMTAEVSIISAEHKNVIIAPLEAFQFKGNHGHATVLIAGGKQVKRTVELGLRNDNSVEVISGLEPNDKIVVPPLHVVDRHKTEIQTGPPDPNQQ